MLSQFLQNKCSCKISNHVSVEIKTVTIKRGTKTVTQMTNQSQEYEYIISTFYIFCRTNIRVSVNREL